jgi:hypothetical protein
VVLNFQEIPFFSIRFSVREAPYDIVGNHTTMEETRSKRKKCYRFLLPVFGFAQHAEFANFSQKILSQGLGQKISPSFEQKGLTRAQVG